jgi:hypothetical protein
MKEDKKLIEVCDKCLRASCWYGYFMCDRSFEAGTILKTREELKGLNREHFSYWDDEYLEKVYGTKNPHGHKI